MAPSEIFLPPWKYLSPRPLPPTKSHISTVPPCFPSSNLHCCLLAAQPPRRRPFFLQRRLLAGYPFSCSAASSPATLFLAVPPPCRRPFFLQLRLLASDPSSCCVTSSPPTLPCAARPRRYGQVIHTPPTPSSSFPVPHAPTDGATPSAESLSPSSN